MRDAIANAHRVVVKVGSSSLTARAGGIDPQRIERLVEALAGVRPPVHVTQVTTDPDTARRWFDVFEGAGLDGVVAKPLAAAYAPGKRIMLKAKHHRSADVVVLGYRVHASGSTTRWRGAGGVCATRGGPSRARSSWSGPASG